MAEKKDTKEAKEKGLKELYAEIEKAHKLPPFDSLNKDFDIDVIDAQSKHLIKEVAKKLFERIELFKKILETSLQPDVSLLSMQEAEYLSETDHEVIADVLRRLMKLDRTLLVAELENDENLYAGFIKDAAEEWSKMKKELSPVIQHMLAGWSTKHKIKQFHHYMG
jgi:hypothetical protein